MMTADRWAGSGRAPRRAHALEADQLDAFVDRLASNQVEISRRLERMEHETVGLGSFRRLRTLWGHLRARLRGA